RAGALDVSLTPMQMKKGRPGVLLAVQAAPANADAIGQLIFRHTTALGVRRQTLNRAVLPRESHSVATAWGAVAGVVATLPDGSKRFTPEHDACRAVSEGADVTLAEVYLAASAAFGREQS
ncbi:MAG: nickel insertion protein, partial [Planctomycetota bacterium]